MTAWRFVMRSLAYHWRMNLAVALGVAAATAVLTGALLVGDSVRGSLQRLTMDRLGTIDEVLVSDRFFRRDAVDHLLDDRLGEIRKGFPGDFLERFLNTLFYQRGEIRDAFVCIRCRPRGS